MTEPITPVPLPAPAEELRAYPSREEVELTVAGVVGAVTPPGGMTTVQRAVLNAHVEAMTGVALDVAEIDPIGPEAFAEGLRARNEAFRTRMVQVMLLAEMLLVPIPPAV